MKTLYSTILKSTNAGKDAYIKNTRKYIGNNASFGNGLDVSKIDYSEITLKQYLECATNMQFEFDLKPAYEFKYECRLNGHVDFYFKDGALSVDFKKYNKIKKFDIFFVKGGKKQVMPLFSSQFPKEYANRVTDTVPSSKRIESVAPQIRKLLELRYYDLTK